MYVQSSIDIYHIYLYALFKYVYQFLCWINENLFKNNWILIKNNFQFADLLSKISKINKYKLFRYVRIVKLHKLCGTQNTSVFILMMLVWKK